MRNEFDMSKSLKRIIYVALVLVIVFFGARIFIFWKLKSTIVSKIDELKARGVLINYYSIESNSFNGSLSITGLEIEKSNAD